IASKIHMTIWRRNVPETIPIHRALQLVSKIVAVIEHPTARGKYFPHFCQLLLHAQRLAVCLTRLLAVLFEVFPVCLHEITVEVFLIFQRSASKLLYFCCDVWFQLLHRLGGRRLCSSLGTLVCDSFCSIIHCA